MSSAEISILDGLLKDRTAILHLNNLTVWGHKVNKADLSYVLKKFDPMSVEVSHSFTYSHWIKIRVGKFSPLRSLDLI